MDEPIWLTRQVVEILHLEQIAEHGGRPGVRDENALEGALARPRQMWTYDAPTTLPKLAAALCMGLAKGHAFADGNKRVALLATYTFLAVNGLVLDADESNAADRIDAIAGGRVDESALAQWIAGHVTP